MPDSYTDFNNGSTYGGTAGMVDNPRLLAIKEVKARATTAQGDLANWQPTSPTAATQSATSFDGGLTETIWTSPVADNYRTRIGSADSGAAEALEDIIFDLTAAENAIIYAGEETVPADSPQAKWPNI